MPAKASPRTQSRSKTTGFRLHDDTLISPNSLPLAACGDCGQLLEFSEYNLEPRCCGMTYTVRPERNALRIFVD